MNTTTQAGNDLIDWIDAPEPEISIALAAREASRFLAEATNTPVPRIAWVKPIGEWERKWCADMAIVRVRGRESMLGCFSPSEPRTIMLAGDLDEPSAAHAAAHETAHAAQHHRRLVDSEEKSEEMAAITCRYLNKDCPLCGTSDAFTTWMTFARRGYQRRNRS